MVTEAWQNIRGKHRLVEVSVNGNNILTKCRLQKNGGSVFIHATSNMKVVKLIKTDEKHMLLYRRGLWKRNISWAQFMDTINLIKKVTLNFTTKSKVLPNVRTAVISGDFNNSSVNWSTISGNGEDKRNRLPVSLAWKIIYSFKSALHKYFRETFLPPGFCIFQIKSGTVTPAHY